MRETEKRIRLYQARLPHLRERIIASLMIFAFSIVMMTMSAFAWVTLSVSPEISGVTMSIAANGNLEVALAYHVLTEIDADGKVVPVRDSNNNLIPLLPGDSAIGDSLLPIKDRNLTWGNLINLTDASYGLDNIVLRPAKLNDDSSMIKIKPFQSVTYGWDGRIIATDDNYRPTQWQIIDAADGEGAFVDSDYLGVKAISSVDILKTEVESALAAEYTYGLNRVFYAFKDARDYYLGDFAAMMESTDTQTSAIAGLLTTYMNGTLYSNLYKAGGPNNVLMHCETTDIQSFLDLMEKLDENVIDNAMLGVMELFDLYRMDTYIDKAAYDADPDEYKKNHMPFTPFNGKEDLDTFYTNAKTMLTQLNNDRVAKGLTKLDDNLFETFNDVLGYKKTITDCITDVETRLASGDTIYWKDIEATVNKLVNISTCTINGDTMSKLFSSIRDNISKLSSMLGNSADKNNAVIHGGLIRDLDTLLHKGVGIRVSRVAVAVTYEALEYRLGDNAWMMSLLGIKQGQSKVVQANVTTDGEEVRNPSVSDSDQTSARSMLKAGYVKETIAALDTYGLSIDFWIRSNEANSYLVLEGEVQEEPIPATKYVTIDGVATMVEPYDVTVTVTKTQIDIETQQPIAGKEPEVTTQVVEAYKGSDGAWYAVADSARIEWNDNTQEGEDFYNIDNKVTQEIQKMDSIITGYSGANRIWDENDLYVDDVEYSTSQGSGSCYTFYADPSELDTILNVLDKMYVVFIDINGNIRAKAKLDTSLCYSEYGKHIVPLVLYEGMTLEIPIYTEEDASGAATVAEEGEEPGTDIEDGTEEDTTVIPTEEIQTIMALEKNEATLLTALIYLDGDKLYNKDVLSSSEIDGQFNIQFGTLERPDPIENEKLQSEQLLISASVAKGKDATDGFSETVDFEGTESSYDVTLKVVTKGSLPTTLDAFFLRKISETQGSRMESVSLKYQGLDAENNGVWTANVSFENAGTYILRSVEVDGIERDLLDMLSVAIPGFTINNFKSTSLTDNPSTYQYLTSADMVKESFSLNMGANSKKEYPSNVQAVFTNENNIKVAINFRPSEAGSTLWSGDATFSTSGTYTMQYLILDGEYYDLQTVYTRKVSLGLKASVLLTKSDEFAENEEFRRNETDTGFEYIFRGTPHAFAATVRIYDNAGAEVRGLAGVKLYYTGEDTDLIWNPGTGVYGPGHLPIDVPGIYEFQRVTVTTLTGSRESIDVAISADTITAIPSDPVSYDGITEDIDDTVYAIAGEVGEISLSFRNASASKVYGKFAVSTSSLARNGVTYRILEATLAESIKSADGQTSKDTYVFHIPAEDAEDGYWTLEDVLVTNVYDGEKGKFYQGDDSFNKGVTVEAFDSAMNAEPQAYYEITKAQLAADPNYKAMKVIKEVNVSNNVGTEVGLKYGDEKTAFMTAHNIGSIKATVTDFEGKAVDNVTVTMKYTLAGGSSKELGGYNYSRGDSGYAVDLTVTKSADGKTFTSNAVTLDHAGKYTPSIMLTFANGATSTHMTQTIEVRSMTPSVTITNITPTGKYSVDKSSPLTDSWTSQEIDSGCLSDYKYTGHTHADHIAAASNTQYIPKIENGVTAYVYFKCSHTDAATYDAGTRNGVSSGPESGEIKSHDYSDAGSPTVTLTLSGLGSNFTNANMKFTNASGGAANMSTAYTSGSTDTYTWTSEGESKRYIGSVTTNNNNNKNSGSDTKTPAGTITANELIVTGADGTQYTFSISQITIHNPY